MPDIATAELNQEEPGRLSLSGTVSFQSSPEILKLSRPYFSSGKALEISMAAVTRVDSSAVALMLEWCRQARRLDMDMDFVQLPEALIDLLRVFKLDSRLPIRQ